MSTLWFNVAGAPQTDIPSLELFDGVSKFPGTFPVPNRCGVEIPPGLSGGAELFYQGRRKSIRVIVPPGPGSWEAGDPTGPCMPPEVGGDAAKMALLYAPLLQSLVRDGIHIRLADGSRYVHAQATNYLLFQRYLEGQDIEPLLYPGFDGYNVTFSMSVVPAQAGLRPLRPEHYADFYPRADQFLSLLASRGKRIEATLLCDCAQLGVDLSWQRSFVGQMTEILRAYPHLLQLANEPPANGVNPADFPRPSGVFASAGSSLSGDACPLPPWDYSTAHLGRGDGGILDAQPSFMTWGYPGYPGTHGPVIPNETRGASDTENSQRRTTDPWYFYEVAAAARGWCGATFHSDNGIHSVPFTPGSPQDLCRLAFLAGITGQAY